jgi:prepilin-type N-terminal cleavage/methylation domain-containing protein
MTPGPDSFTRPGGCRGAFTLVELLTVLALIAVLATLVASSIAGAKLRAQQTVCSGNLRQLITAIEIYTRETGKRPRSVTRLSQRSNWVAEPRILLCPSDPATRVVASTNTAWGNVANASQEPWNLDRTLFGNPETGSWQAELSESVESVSFSYLHTLGWRKQAWQRLTATGKDAGLAVCQLHGVKVPPSSLPPGAKPFLLWEGQTYRAQQDGSVVPRKIFRSSGNPGPGGEITTTAVQPAPGTEYPWEFYLDSVPPQR